LHNEGVAPIYLLSDAPDAYHAAALAPGAIVRSRDDIDQVMLELRDTPGCSAIVYVQTCAAEKRRRRARKIMVDPPKRVFINAAVCEGCGDCSVQSNCVSVEPLETEHGRKRRINQSTCNKDYSCLKGFCPSFVTVHGGTLRKRSAGRPDVTALPEPIVPDIDVRPWNTAIAGVGGTGILTVGAVLGMAAHLDGRAPMILDMAGLAQKGGAVMSHVRIGARHEDVTSPRIVTGGADLLLAADIVVAASKDAVTLCEPKRTVAVVNTHLTPVADFVRNRDFDFNTRLVERTVRQTLRGDSHFVDFTRVAEAVAGDAIAANIMMIGYAWQKGLIPLSRASIDQAIELNGVAVEANRIAFDWGRLLAADPAAVEPLLERDKPAKTLDEMSLDELVAHRVAHLTAYQDARFAGRYLDLVERARTAAGNAGLGDALSRTVAHVYARLLAYKDEYEVARLFTDPAFEDALESQFEGDYSISFNLAPPMLPGRDANGRPKKRVFGFWLMRVFRVLAKLRRLRGTWLDVFGYSAERRTERALIREYEALVERVLPRLGPHNEAAAIELLALYGDIRGCGPVKAEALETVRLRQGELLAAFEAETGETTKAAA
jgi:indolepyruvate ferredoxin oxidoreductase